LPWKLRFGKASTVKRTFLPFADAADVGFGKARIDAHLREILRDLDQRRRLQAGGDGLPEVDHAVDDDAGDRRADRRVAQVDLILVGGGLRLRELRLARAARLDRLFEFLARNVFLFEEGFHARFVGAREIERGAHVDHVGRRLPGLRGEQPSRRVRAAPGPSRPCR
jgi:hypothetical protein